MKHRHEEKKEKEEENEEIENKGRYDCRTRLGKKERKLDNNERNIRKDMGIYRRDEHGLKM